MVGRPRDIGAETDRRRRRKRRIEHGLLPGLVGYNLRRAQVSVFQDFRVATSAFDITPGQFGILVLIANNDGLSQSDLGNALGIDRSTMVAVIDRLERRNLVVRAPSPADRRSYALRLSSTGAAFLANIVPTVQDHEKTIGRGLTAEEKETLIRLLGKLAAD